MTRVKLMVLALLLAIAVSGCPSKPNPYCPNNTCGKAPTSTR